MNQKESIRQSREARDAKAARYDDILYMARPASRHPKASREARAMQFAPFAALTGFEAIIDDAKAEYSAAQPEFYVDNLLD